MLYLIVSFLGCIIGYFIAKFTKEELKKGEIYFKILELVVLLSLVVVFLFNSFNVLFLILGLVLGFLLRFEYFYFGLGLVSVVDFLGSALVFLYGLPYGSLTFYHKKKKYLFFSFILFLVGLLNYFFNYNLASLSAGGLISLFIIKLWKIIH